MLQTLAYKVLNYSAVSNCRIIREIESNFLINYAKVYIINNAKNLIGYELAGEKQDWSKPRGQKPCLYDC